MPIQVIVVLFVALLVGGAILAFSRITLNNAQQSLNDQWKNDPAHKDQVVEVDTLTTDALVGLAQDCVKKNAGTVEEKICFAVFFNSVNGNILGLDNRELGYGFNLSTQALTANPNTKAIRLIYNPFTNHVDVT